MMKWLKQGSLPLKISLSIVLLIVVLDQLSKLWFNNTLSYGETQAVFPGFDLLLVHNRGAAFSFLSDAGGWQRWILAGISFFVSIAIGIWLWRLPPRQALLALALSLVLGGALGNLYDRLVLGYVIDFISVYFKDWRFATFNVADAAISVGAVLLALEMLIGGEPDAKA